MDDGGRLTLRTRRQGDRVCVEIGDDGPGIPRRAAGPRVRRLLHHQARRPGHRPGAGHRPADRRAPPRRAAARVAAGRHALPGATAPRLRRPGGSGGRRARRRSGRRRRGGRCRRRSMSTWSACDGGGAGRGSAPAKVCCAQRPCWRSAKPAGDVVGAARHRDGTHHAAEEGHAATLPPVARRRSDG